MFEACGVTAEQCISHKIVACAAQCGADREYIGTKK